jgi:hypothetical protein
MDNFKRNKTYAETFFGKFFTWMLSLLLASIVIRFIMWMFGINI